MLNKNNRETQYYDKIYNNSNDNKRSLSERNNSENLNNFSPTTKLRKKNHELIRNGNENKEEFPDLLKDNPITRSKTFL